MTRTQAEKHIEDLFGSDPTEFDAGDCFDTLLSKMGLSALTDEAVIRLAEIQSAHNENAHL